MNVYRVAHPTDDAGPYRLRARNDALRKLANNMGAAHAWHPTHPIPVADGVPDYDGDNGDRCAFESLDSLYEWFEGWLAQLDREGYQLRTYRVARRCVRKGARQVVFDINQAQHVATERLVEAAL